jgi:hypothetical protein
MCWRREASHKGKPRREVRWIMDLGFVIGQHQAVALYSKLRRAWTDIWKTQRGKDTRSFIIQREMSRIVRRKNCWQSQGEVCVAEGYRGGEKLEKAVPVHALKEQRRRRGTAPLLLTFGIGCRWLLSLVHLPLYPGTLRYRFNTKLGDPINGI